MKSKHISLTLKTFTYFIIFAFVIVLVFWFLEIAVLDQFYAETKKNNCYEVAEQIEYELSEYNKEMMIYNTSDLANVFSDLENDNEMNIWLIHRSEFGLVTNIYGKTLNPITVTNLWNKIKKSTLNENFTETGSDFIFSKIIKLSDSTEVLIILVSRIVPVDSIVQVWRRQFFVISIVIIGLTAIFATLVSRSVSRPIASLNKAARNLAKGKYDTKFEAHDYVEIKELADTLNYASNELGKLDNYQKELIANVSHDLRTPLTLIAGYSEMMKDYPSEISKENLQIIIDEANRLTSLVNDILNLTKMQSDTTTYEKEEYNLTENIEGIINRNAKLLSQVGCTVTFEYEEDIIIYADIRKIEIALYNFLNNAVNYCGEDKLVIVKQEIEGSYAKISFIDHGIGIDKEHIEDIWNRYYKGNQSHNRGIGGSGLGLSIVKSVLEGHGFEYGVDSELGKGSQFWFKVPVVKKMESEKSE
ncbi:MAG: HAMP domain-containing histidine kinase [Bacilli bacterium]|nr:HAMP domain-containing histidine kinase [Bacilli bacterium]